MSRKPPPTECTRPNERRDTGNCDVQRAGLGCGEKREECRWCLWTRAVGEAERKETLCRTDISGEGDRVGTEVCKVDQRPVEVACDDRSTSSWLGVEPADVNVQQVKRHASNLDLCRAAELGIAKPPGS